MECRSPRHRSREHRQRPVVGAPCDAAAVNFEFDAELWLWEARRDDSWTFVRLPDDASEDIHEMTGGGPRRGFGAVRVRVRVGATTWRTSIFPSGANEAYVLPVK